MTYILEGSIRRSSGRVRIVGQLIDARNDRHVWADTYDKDISDVFAIQTDVARSIAHALAAALSPEEVRRIGKSSTLNLDAYGHYLRGREYYYRYTRDDNEHAIEFFKRALESDPGYALAYAGLGDAYGMRKTRYGFGVEWADSAIAASTTAISLDPGLAEGYKALGLSLDGKGKVREAMEQYYKAIELNPNYAPVVANLGSAHFSLGHFDEALLWVKKAVSLQPSSPLFYTLVGLQYFSLGLDSAASAWLTRALSLQPESVFPVILFSYIDAYGGKIAAAQERIGSLLLARPDERGALEAAGDLELLGGDFNRARCFFERACDQIGVESPAGVKLAYALMRLGRAGESRRKVDSIIAAFDLPGTRYPEGSQIPLLLAESYALKKDTVKSARWLETAVLAGYSDYRWASSDPLLDEVRTLPSGQRIMVTMKERLESMRARVQSMDQSQ